MWLINTKTLSLEDALEVESPAYAILSHRWEGEEVTHQDLRDWKRLAKRGWKKLTACCAKALEDGWEYVVRALKPSYLASIVYLSEV
jgi:hypothetical protein